MQARGRRTSQPQRKTARKRESPRLGRPARGQTPDGTVGANLCGRERGGEQRQGADREKQPRKRRRPAGRHAERRSARARRGLAPRACGPPISCTRGRGSASQHPARRTSAPPAGTARCSRCQRDRGHSPREIKVAGKTKTGKKNITDRTPRTGPHRTQGCKMAPDPYRTLDVPRSATQDEIKKAFRAKAQQYHPDVVGPSASVAERAAAEAKFKEANAAYDVGPPARAPARARRRAWCGVGGCTAATGTLDCPAGRDCWHVSCLSPARALGRCSAMP